MRFVLIIFSLINFYQQVFSQDTTSAFIEYVTNDSIIVYFNERQHMVKKECAMFKRHIKIDESENFNGSFIDSCIQNNTIYGKGFYNHGIKDGYFEIYYTNGNKRCEGRYEKNIPVGEWQFYYENGKRERMINVNKREITVLEMFNKKEEKTIENGNGKFDGAIQFLSQNNVIANGKIVNGKQDGKWSAKYEKGNMVLCKENFQNGKFISGNFPNAIYDDSYSDKPLLSNFFLENYCTYLEKTINIQEHCSEREKYKNTKNINVIIKVK